MNITVITALIAAIAAIISPLITTVINNKHQMKVQVEFKYICDKLQAYNDFLAAFEKLEMSFESDNFKNKTSEYNAKHFYSTVAKIASYTNNEELIEKLYQCGDAALGSYCIAGNTLQLFNECTKMMNSEIKKEQKKLRLRR